MDSKFNPRYAGYGYDSLMDIFPNGKKTSDMLKLKDNKPFRSVYSRNNKAEVVRHIFYDFMIMVLEEIANGGMLEFPGTTGAYIALKPMDDEAVERNKDTYRMKHIDLVEARFKVPVFRYDFGPKSPRKDIFIYVPKRILEKAARNAEAGTIRYTYKYKRLRYDL